MKSRLELLEFEKRPVTIIYSKGEPWWIGKQVAEILGYAKGANAIKSHVDREDKGVTKMMTPGGKQKVTIINESGLYSLILSSKLPRAKRFKHWVTSEVLPAIRKNGAYMTDAKAFDVIHSKTGLADLLQQAADQLKQKDVQIEEMAPKALFADAVSTSKSTILIGQLAKIMRQNGIDIGQNRLFAWLRIHGYLGKYGNNYNVPTQYSVDHGWFKTKETAVQHSNGHITIQMTVKVTGKGQQYFINKFLRNSEIIKQQSAGTSYLDQNIRNFIDAN